MGMGISDGRILQDQEPEMRHVLVGNETRVFERSAWQPEGIVSNRAGLVALPRLQCHGRNYYRTYTDGQWAFFCRNLISEYFFQDVRRMHLTESAQVQLVIDDQIVQQ